MRSWAGARSGGSGWGRDQLCALELLVQRTRPQTWQLGEPGRNQGA